jgi:hypothetical protein
MILPINPEIDKARIFSSQRTQKKPEQLEATGMNRIYWIKVVLIRNGRQRFWFLS